jgi:hypothetical protein
MKTFIFLAIIVLIGFGACQNKNNSFYKEKINGYSQKGPFVNGSSITLFELDEELVQTGNSYNTQIIDNLGSFELSGINLETSVVKFKADGFYFNEIKNSTSTASITLYALSDLTDKSIVNVNLLSTLDVSRIEYLVSQGNSFNDSKQQAQEEILNIFAISSTDIAQSEQLDISQDGEDNAILLAISLILQGYRTEAELTQLLGDISTDIRTDGVLNSTSIGSSLINDAVLLQLAAIRNNIENKYEALGVNATIPNFEFYVNQFIENTSYTITKKIEYPITISGKTNLLYNTTYNITNNQYYVGAYLPVGTTLSVVVKSSPGYSAVEYGWATMNNNGWTFDNHYPDSAVLTATGNNQTVSIPFMFGPPSSLDFIIYENNSTVPTRINTIQY